MLFLSTPSARRATVFHGFTSFTSKFLSTPSARRATCLPPLRRYCKKFLSTPSARRATATGVYCRAKADDFYPRPPRGGRRPGLSVARNAKDISIHALREEGDSSRRPSTNNDGHFYPRPPRGGRRCRCSLVVVGELISIHALREEGDPLCSAGKAGAHKFLSTPSARRATHWGLLQSKSR